MSGVEVIAVVACVAAGKEYCSHSATRLQAYIYMTVISAYHDGSAVFQEVRKKWRERRTPHPQAASSTAIDLENSLQRSRVDILTQWNGHVGRLGQRFEVGDEIAQATMKDILIGLQITLLTHLREDGAHLDIFALLNISDLSRARTISAMHELYQRLAQTAPIPWQMMSPVAPGLPIIEPHSGLAQYIGVINTLSSSQAPTEQHSYPAGFYYSPGQPPPGQIPGRVFTGSISSSPPEITSASHRPSVDAGSPRDRGDRRFSSISSTFNWLRDRRRSSVESSDRSERDDRSDIAAFSGLPSGVPTGLPSPPQSSYVEPSGARQIPQRRPSELEAPVEQNVLSENPWISVIEEKEQEREDYNLIHGQQGHHGHTYDYNYSPSHMQQYQNLPQQHHDHNQKQQQQQQQQQAPVPGYRPGLKTPPPTQHISNPNLGVPRAPPTPSIHSDVSLDSGSSNRSDVIILPLSTTVALWPPSRSNDYAGFCKGAWKQNSGFEGFKVHSVPIGYYSLVPKWKCVSCFFEMPMASTDSHSNSQSQSRGNGSNDASFDQKVYTHAASKIRYRWSFLAKSHIARKTRNNGDASRIGTFGCMFCCFENDRSALAFGSLDVFMNHLGAVHRGFVGSLLGSTRCVVGRVAGVEENFDINILPA